MSKRREGERNSRRTPACKGVVSETTSQSFSTTHLLLNKRKDEHRWSALANAELRRRERRKRDEPRVWKKPKHRFTNQRRKGRSRRREKRARLTAHVLSVLRLLRDRLRNKSRTRPSENGRNAGGEVEVGGSRRLEAELHEVVRSSDVRLEGRDLNVEVDEPGVLRTAEGKKKSALGDDVT